MLFIVVLPCHRIDLFVLHINIILRRICRWLMRDVFFFWFNENKIIFINSHYRVVVQTIAQSHFYGYKVICI